MSIRSKWVFNFLLTFLSVLLLAGSVTLFAPTAALAAGSDITISGPGLNNTGPVTFTQNQLRSTEQLPDGTEFEQQDVIYSTINTWPTKSWYRGQGVKLSDLLKAAGGIKPEATQIKFVAKDGFAATFTVEELLNAPRYRFPKFMNTGLPGHLRGDSSGKVLVDPIIAHQSFSAQSYNDTQDPENFSRADANHLLYGQRAVTQQTNARFAKYVQKIEVLTDSALEWDDPTVTPVAGVVEAGTEVEMHSPYDDEDKVHYTTDGTVPTIDSPMYNWIAKRWWSSRSDDLNQINHKIPINSDTTIKAVVIGPGRKDSGVISFNYKIETPPDTTAPIWVDDSLTVSDITQTGLTLSWDAATDNVGVTGYKVYQGGVVINTVNSETLTYNVTGLTPETEYTFKVEAVDAAGNESTDGPSITISTATLPDTEAPAWTNGSLTASDVYQTTLTLSWSGASDNVGVTGYKVYQGGVVINTVNSETLTYNVTGLTPETEYTFKVEAVDAAGNESTDGPSTTVSTATRPDLEAPAWTNGSLTASNVGQTTLTLNWSGASDSVGVTGYKVYQGGVVIDTVSSETLTYNVAGLTPETEYTFKIEAVDAAGNESTDGPSTTVSTATRPDLEAPAWTNGSLTASNAGQTTLTLNWSGASDNVGVTGYKVYQGGIVINTVNSETLTYNVTGLTPETEYTFKVEAVDAAGNESTDGPGTTVSTATLPDTEAPAWTNGSLTASDVDQTTLTLTWSGASDNVGVTGYKVFQDGTLLTKTPVTESSYEVTGLTAGTEYTFKVEAVDVAGNESIDGPSTDVTTKTAEMETVAKPNAWPAGGAVVAGTQVTLATTTTGAVIYYTIDSSVPTAASTIYTGPITISEPVTIKAIAAMAGMTDSDISTASFTIAVPIVDSEVTVTDDGSNKDLAITQDTSNLAEPVKINVPSAVQDATVSVTALMNDPDPETGTVTTCALPALNIDVSTGISATAPVKLEIPAGANISAPADWNGTINVPRVQEKNTVQVTPDTGMTAQVDTVIEVGFGDVPLTFNKAVRILIPGKAGRDAGYYRNSQFCKINSLPSGALDDQAWADQNIPDSGDGKLDVGSDLVIWTKHFTKFVTYTQTEKSSSGGGGGSSLSQAVTSTTGTATVKPSAGGTISLGSEATIKVTANALTGTSLVEVKVQKVTTPPAVPVGFKLVGSIYEFSVGGENSYSFARDVTITLSFDPEALSLDETPAIYYYDEALGQWINIGGTVSGNTVTVQVDHFTKFAVMAAAETPKEDKPKETLKDIAGHWAVDSINQLVTMGAINGYPDGSFKPDNTITRAEFATVLVKAFQLASRDGRTFTDTAGHWARDYITAAADNGVVNGYDTGALGPDDLITREQMAVMVVNAAKLPMAAGESQFADSGSISSWAREAVVTATQNGIMQGYLDNTIQPLGNATRAEAVTVIVNALKK